MVNVKNILIVYGDRRIRDFLCLSTFFTLCGVYTEGIRAQSTVEMETARSAGLCGCGCVIVLVSDTKDVFIDGERFSINSDYGNCSLIGKVLSALFSQRLIEKQAYDSLECLRRIYIKHCLRRAEYDGQCYFYIKQEMDSIYNFYYLACQDLQVLQAKNEEDPYLWYVRGQFIWRMHDLAMVSENAKVYDIEKVIAKLTQMVDKYPEFISFYALMGHLSETDGQWKESARKYYELYLKNAEGGIYTSKVYYSLGHWWEVRKNQQEAVRNYKKAYEVNEKNYRALYKIAKYNEHVLKNYAQAWTQYNMIQKQLEEIYFEGYIQPIENEYLFKVYYSKLMMKKRNEYAVEEDNLEEKLNALTRQKVENSLFFQEFYEEDSGRYFQYMLNRIINFKNKI